VSRIVLGTRGSALALAQASLTQQALAAVFPDLEISQEVFITRGDKKLDLSLIRANEAGGKGLFTKELEDALLAGTIDVAVHSLKDLPGHLPDGLQLAAVLERAPTADVLITREAIQFKDLPNGARIGTSSVRRARQLQVLRKDLRIEEWRGNVQTRLRKLLDRRDVTGIVLAEAGLLRLGYHWSDGMLESDAGRFFATSLSDMLLPAIGQGAIALQSRIGDSATNGVLARINHQETWLCIRAERELQRLLAGDCSLPVGVRTRLKDGTIEMSVILFGPEGDPPATASTKGPAESPESVALRLFRKLSLD
jgi:hydroxymethylbilane synthase